jgi:hypothetical protein
MEASFFRGALQRVESRRRSRNDSGGPESTTRLPKWRPLCRAGSVWNGCARLPRSAVPFLQVAANRTPGAEDATVRAAIQEIAIAHHRNYGYR